MTTDEEFARELRERALAAAPPSAVDLDAVIPRARRRRARGRAAGAGALALVAVTGVVAAQAWAGGPGGGASDVGPAGTGSLGRTATVAPTDGASLEAEAEAARRAAEAAAREAASGPAATDAAGTDGAGTIEPGSGTAQGAAPYWYVLMESPAADGGTERTETWRSRELPGLIVSDGDLTAPAAMGPTNVVGRFRIDGVWVDMLRDPALLPTDAGALGQVLRDSVEPDRGGEGSDDDKVFGMVQDLLRDGGILPTDLLRAAVGVAGGLPGATVADGTDDRGRPGTVVEYRPSTGGTERLVVDPATGLPLQVGDAVYLEQHSAEDTPVEPTLEMAGCGESWETC
ncbi:hypothetical protein [Cellulomonas olei]|uniref:hypothetical protein n=1 Tax=Cellulomonas sp. P4 TaxID=3142533 RepID=UPI0031BA2C78